MNMSEMKMIIVKPFNKVMSFVPAEVSETFAALTPLQPGVMIIDDSTSADVNQAQQTVSEN
jgi:hypothetical protein